MPTKSQSQCTLELLHNHRDQRNPFKIPGKNHELSLKQGNDGDDKKSVKNEKENREVLDSDKRELQKFSSESFREALLSGITIESQQFAEGKSESRERIEAQTKSCKSAIETEKPNSKLHKYGFSKMFEISSGHMSKDLAVRSTEDVLQKGVRPKQSLPNFNSQISNTKPVNGEQPGKGDSKTCRDKTGAVKANGERDSDGRIEETTLISTELVSAQKCTSLPSVPPKGNPEEQPVFQTGTVPQEKICPSKDVGSDVLVPRKLPVELAPEEKVHHQKNVSSDSQERVLQKKAVVNSKDLHNHLTAQLRQKKVSLFLSHTLVCFFSCV